jgi:hypothetical protein
MEELIFEKKISLPDIICDQLIDYFNNKVSEIKINDCCGLDLNNDCKNHYKISNCRYVVLESNCELHNFLNNELFNCLNEYKTKLHFELNTIINKLVINDYHILKYDINNGYSTKHFNLNKDKKYVKIFNFIWFLNNCENGGEIDFFKKYKIIPEKGKFVIFPTEWFFLFSDNIPKSCDKYIIEGWIYMYIT